MKSKKAKIAIIIVVVVLVIGILGFIGYKMLIKKPNPKDPATNVTTVTNEITGYDYTLEDRDTEIFSNDFHELKELLEKEEKEEDFEEKYATLISKLFVIDLFTIDNKISKYDVGGLEFIYENARESFRSKIIDSIYKTVEDNSYNTRNQTLPIVTDAEVLEIKETTYQIEDTTYNAYEVKIQWKYEKDLGYDYIARLTLIKEENKLSIVSYAP